MSYLTLEGTIRNHVIYIVDIEHLAEKAISMGPSPSEQTQACPYAMLLTFR